MLTEIDSNDLFLKKFLSIEYTWYFPKPSKSKQLVVLPEASVEATYWQPTAICVIRNLPFTITFSALIFTQTLTKDKGDCCFLWLTQASTSKHIETPLSQ